MVWGGLLESDVKETKGLLKVQGRSVRQEQNPHLDVTVNQNNKVTETNNQTWRFWSCHIVLLVFIQQTTNFSFPGYGIVKYFPSYLICLTVQTCIILTSAIHIISMQDLICLLLCFNLSQIYPQKLIFFPSYFKEHYY